VKTVNFIFLKIIYISNFELALLSLMRIITFLRIKDFVQKHSGVDIAWRDWYKKLKMENGKVFQM